MSRIEIRRNHGLSRETVREQAESLVEGLSTRYGLRYQWQGDELHFRRTGVKGRVVFDDESLAIHAELGMLLGGLRTPIEQEIERRLDAFLSA